MNWSKLEGSAFILRVKPGMAAEYEKRHDELWPEMAEALKAQGIVFYEIFLDEKTNRVFGHMIRDRHYDPDTPEPEVVLKWRRHMADVLEFEGDKPARDPLRRVFYLTA